MREPESSEHLLAPGSSYSPQLSLSHKHLGSWCSDCLRTNCALTILTPQLLRSLRKPQWIKPFLACPGPFVSDGELQAPEFILLTKQQQLPIDKSHFYLQTVDMGEKPSQLRPMVTWNKVTFKDTAVLKYYKHQSTTFLERLRQSIYRDCSRGGLQGKCLHSLCECAISNGKPREKWSS